MLEALAVAATSTVGRAGAVRAPEKGALVALATQAGLEPIDGGYIEAPLRTPTRNRTSARCSHRAPASLAIRTSGEEALCRALLNASAPCCTAHGGYRIETDWRFRESVTRA